MSLISTKNLLAPFRKTVHLVTIVLIAFVFVIWRWAGGALFVEDKQAPEEQRSIIQKEIDSRRQAVGKRPSPAEEKRIRERMSRSKRGEPLLGSLQNRKDGQKGKKDSSERSKSSLILDDIERELGMQK